VVGLLSRIAYIQIVQGEELRKKAFEQHNRGRILSPKRGTIYDRNGKELAISASVETISINPKDVKLSIKDRKDITLESIASELAEILDMEQETVLSRMQRETWYEVLKKKVDRSIGNTVREWLQETEIQGVYVDEDSKRFYMNGNLAAHIIGFTGDDNQGLDGIEAVMDKYLKGESGRILSELDAGGHELPFSVEKRIDAQDGLNLVLTIDETIQYFAQKALDNAVADWKVTRGATAIVMDPRNGDILALAVKPDYDLNDPFAYPNLLDGKTAESLGISPETWIGKASDTDVDILRKTVWRNYAVVDTYEPGSTFKAITTSAGLEEGVVHPDDRVNDSPVTIAGHKLQCWRYYNLHGEESFREGVYNSCNPVFVRVAQALGIDRFYSYVKAFGFMEKTDISLPGEQLGLFHEKPTEIDMAVASFGQSFTITPIQLITAYCAIANGGDLVKPRLVKEVTDSQHNIVERFEPQIVRSIISKETSDTVKDILEGVVSIGTGKNAYVKGYSVAGKTGTSETIPRNSGRYIASFAAFAPADNPVICVLVVFDDPRGDSYMGGIVAAPVAGGLIEDTLNYLGVERIYTEKDMEMLINEVYVPGVKDMTVEQASAKLRERGLKYRVEGENTQKDAVVLKQTPAAEASIPEGSVVILYMYDTEDEATVVMPNVLNKTISEVTEALENVGLNVRVNGMGVSFKQAFAPGETVKKGEVVEIDFMHLDNIE
jgi:stage V sporulation protein D (sporulation-specific penicillin-binding protein)